MSEESEISIQRKYEMVREAQPSSIQYRGLGRNPDSNIQSVDDRRAREAEEQAAVAKLDAEIDAHFALKRSTTEINEPTSPVEPFTSDAIPPDGTAAPATKLPFEISVTATELRAAPGVVFSDPHVEEVNLTMTNGTWYFQAKATINSTTGAITATDVFWATTESTNTATDFYLTIGEVQIIGGVPDSSTIVQYTYGPIRVQLYGAATAKWEALLY